MKFEFGSRRDHCVYNDSVLVTNSATLNYDKDLKQVRLLAFQTSQAVVSIKISKLHICFCSFYLSCPIHEFFFFLSTICLLCCLVLLNSVSF